MLAPHSIYNLFVPGDKVVYATPELVVHYINAHEYRPPQVFQDAVLRCPQMNSRAYFWAMKAAWPDFRALASPPDGQGLQLRIDLDLTGRPKRRD